MFFPGTVTSRQVQRSQPASGTFSWCYCDDLTELPEEDFKLHGPGEENS